MKANQSLQYILAQIKTFNRPTGQVPECGQATVNSVKTLTWNMGWAVGPYLSGVIQQAYGFNPIFILTGILYATSVAVTWVLFRKREEPLTQPGVWVVKGQP